MNKMPLAQSVAGDISETLPKPKIRFYHVFFPRTSTEYEYSYFVEGSRI